MESMPHCSLVLGAACWAVPSLTKGEQTVPNLCGAAQALAQLQLCAAVTDIKVPQLRQEQSWLPGEQPYNWLVV